MTDEQSACLQFLANETRPNGEMCVPFAPIERATGLSRKIVRRSVRALARKGLAEYHRALWNDDGMPAGAGYCITRKGLQTDD